MKNDIKLILCDIDGTLLTTGNPLGERTRYSINKIREMGIWFGLSSGRTVDELHKTTRSWGYEEDFECLIGVNGAQLYDGISKQFFNYFDMKPEWIKAVLDFMRPFNLNPYVYTADTTVYLYEDENVERARQRAMRKVIVANGDERMLYEGIEVPKILYRMPVELVPAVMEAGWKNCPAELYKPIKTQDFMVEFAPSGADKAYAMDRFLERNNLTRDNVMSFGDNSNDNGMLEASGIGVCLKNGAEDTKACSDIITDLTCNEEGVADFLEKYFGYSYEK